MLDVQSASAMSVGIRSFENGTIALVERIEIKLDTATTLLMILEKNQNQRKCDLITVYVYSIAFYILATHAL